MNSYRVYKATGFTLSTLIAGAVITVLFAGILATGVVVAVTGVPTCARPECNTKLVGR